MHNLPLLPYPYEALEPWIDAETMHIHHDKHHQTYVDKLNETLQNHPDLAAKPVEELLRDLNSLPDDIKGGVRNFGGGHYNHSIFWEFLKSPKDGGGVAPQGTLAERINADFGGFDKFKEQFSAAAAKLFGSGWACLAVGTDPSAGSGQGGKLQIISLKDQDAAITVNMKPVMILDVWEHAYYLKYRNKRVDYIQAWWNIANWAEAEKRLTGQS